MLDCGDRASQDAYRGSKWREGKGFSLRYGLHRCSTDSATPVTANKQSHRAVHAVLLAPKTSAILTCSNRQTASHETAAFCDAKTVNTQCPAHILRATFSLPTVTDMLYPAAQLRVPLSIHHRGSHHYGTSFGSFPHTVSPRCLRARRAKVGNPASLRATANTGLAAMTR